MVSLKEFMLNEFYVSDYEWAVYGITSKHPDTWNEVSSPEELLKYQR